MNVNFKMFVDVQHYSNLSDTVNYSTQTSYISPQLPHLHNKGYKNSTAGEMKIISHLTWYYTIHLWSSCPLNLLVYSLLWSKCQCDHSTQTSELTTRTAPFNNETEPFWEESVQLNAHNFRTYFSVLSILGNENRVACLLAVVLVSEVDKEIILITDFATQSSSPSTDNYGFTIILLIGQ